MANGRKYQHAGFSLIELMVVVAILVIVMGAVINQINNVQKRYVKEEQGLEISQESREFFDQMARDLHQVGYPNSKMYATGTLMNPPENDSRNAVGIVKFAYDEIWFEGDVDGDGVVDVVDYKLQTDAVNGQCPCRISRSVVTKANATAPTAQISTNFSTELQDVVNSGGANGGASDTPAYPINGSTYLKGAAALNDTLYQGYKSANVFTAYDESGNLVAPTNYAAGATALKSIRTIKININLLARQMDQQSKLRPAVALSASVRIPAN